MKRIVVTLLAAGFVAPTFADDLPGVKQPEPIVQPIPEPSDEASMDEEAVPVGDWDVKVSGSVSVDISAGAATTRPPR